MMCGSVKAVFTYQAQEYLVNEAYKEMVSFVQNCRFIDKVSISKNLTAETEAFIEALDVAMCSDRSKDRILALISQTDPRVMYCVDQRLSLEVMMMIAYKETDEWPFTYEARKPFSSVLITAWHSHCQHTRS